MNRATTIDSLSARMSEIKRRFGVKSLSLFGSVARNEASESSDIDLLVEFEGPADFDRFMDLKFFIEDLLGRSVDLATKKSLRPGLRLKIEKEAIHVA